MSARLLGPLMVDVAGHELTSEDREILQHPLVGGLILFTRNYADPEQVRLLIRDIRATRRPELLIAVDYEGGRVQRFRGPSTSSGRTEANVRGELVEPRTTNPGSGFTVLPPAQAYGRLYDEDPERAKSLAQAGGWMIGKELGAIGADLSFSPVLDLGIGVSSVIGNRAFHASAEAVAELGLAHMRGLKDAGMAATGKHFPGHGRVVEDSHEALPVDRRSLEEVREQDMSPFQRLIEEGLPSVMMAHILFPAVDRQPASLSRRWIMDELRERLGFRGTVFCDDISMNGAASVGSYPDRAAMALEAGCDMLPVCNNRTGVIELLDNLRAGPDRETSGRLESLRCRRGPESLQELQQTAAWRQKRQDLGTLA